MEEKNQSLDLIAPVPPESLITDPEFPWAWILLALLLLTGFIILIIKRKSSATDPLKLRNAAFNEASNELSQIQTDDVRTTAVQASLILRKYLSVVADDPALFETHEEFISRQDSLKKLSTQARAAAEAGFTRLASLKYSLDTPSINETEIIEDSRMILVTLHQGFIA